MIKVQITRHYTANNISDYFSFGNHEHEGNAAMTEYLLPEGYSIADECIYDPANIECALQQDKHGTLVLMSLAGSCPDVTLVPA
jgi:hypothetical protein